MSVFVILFNESGVVFYVLCLLLSFLEGNYLWNIDNNYGEGFCEKSNKIGRGGRGRQF